MIIVIELNKSIHFKKGPINFEDCWVYTGKAYWIKGYPIIKRHNKNYIASRYIWFLFTGRDYAFKEIHHKCKLRSCVNPFHLQELTAKRHRKIHSTNRRQ